MYDYIMASIGTKWVTDSMADTFTGGWFSGRVAQAQMQYPYVQFMDLGQPANGFSSTGHNEDYMIQATAWMKENRSTDPQTQLGNLARALKIFLDRAELTVPSSYGKFDMINYQTAMVIDDGGGIYRSVQTYKAQVKVKTIAP
jgi:hypothetical protein